MKKFFILLFSFQLIFCYSDQLIEQIQKNTQSQVVFRETSKSLYLDLKNKTDFFITRFFEVEYEDDKTFGTVNYIMNDTFSKVLLKLRNHNLIKIEAVSNISNIQDLWDSSMNFMNTQNFSVKEYIRDTGNAWSTDDFGFIFTIQNNYFKIIDIKLFNVFSTYIEEGKYPSPWNRNVLANYKDQQNKGILFYYMIENAIKKITEINDTVFIIGVLDDNGVRLREKPDLSSQIISNLRQNEKVYILDCENEAYEISGYNFPWVKVQTEDNKIGYVYGQYLQIGFE